ncbi:F-box/LRR-repeat protein 3 [Linum perenne]
MKRHQTTATSDYSYFDLLSDEVVFAILDFLGSNPLDRKSFSLVCRSFYHTESRHRRSVKPLRHEHLPRILSRYRSVSRLDLSLCPRISDGSLSLISGSCGETLRSIDLSRSRFFSYGGLVSLAVNCKNLVEIDLSNATELRDAAASAVAEAKNLEKLWLGRCKLITDMGVGCIAVGCKKLRLISLKWCLGVTDLGVGLIAVKCKELRSLDLSYLPACVDLCRSAGIGDSGILAIASGCPDLEMINMSYCKDITDSSLISLSKCLRLNTFESRGCSLITSLGLAAIAVGCRQLSKLDVKKCHSIDDAGMLPLAHFSQGLRQIILSYTSVTDVGLLSLASISCLQSITVLHLSGLTAGGLTAALLACCGLVKVKLHASFKPLLPPLLFEHLEARGCSFEWRDKEFQAELDPQCWKLQLEDVAH